MSLSDKEMEGAAEDSARSERRREQRMRCIRLGRCVFNGGYTDLEVMIRSLSRVGARIEGDGVPWLPERFELHIRNGLGGYVKQRARRMWTRGNVAGLEFEEAK